MHACVLTAVAKGPEGNSTMSLLALTGAPLKAPGRTLLEEWLEVCPGMVAGPSEKHHVLKQNSAAATSRQAPMPPQLQPNSFLLPEARRVAFSRTDREGWEVRWVRCGWLFNYFAYLCLACK